MYRFALALALLRGSLADIPAHCLQTDVLGDWTFSVGDAVEAEDVRADRAAPWRAEEEDWISVGILSAPPAADLSRWRVLCVWRRTIPMPERNLRSAQGTAADRASDILGPCMQSIAAEGAGLPSAR